MRVSYESAMVCSRRETSTTSHNTMTKSNSQEDVIIQLDLNDLKAISGTRGPLTRFVLKKWREWITKESKEVVCGLGGLQCHVDDETSGSNKTSYVEGFNNNEPDPFGGAITGKK